MINLFANDSRSEFSPAEDRERTKLFEYLEALGVAICIITMGALALVHSLHGGIRWNDLSDLVYLTMLFSFLYALSRAGWGRLAILLQCVGAIFFAAWLLVRWDGISGQFQMFFAIVILFSASFLGEKAMVFVTGVSIAIYTSLVLSQYFGLIAPPRRMIPEELIVTTLMVSNIGFISIALLSRALTILVKKRGEAIAISEAKYRELVETAPDMIISFDFKARIADINRRGLEVLGYSKKEVVGNVGTMLVAPEDVSLLSAYFRSFKRTGAPTIIEMNLVDKDGRAIPVEVNHSIILDDGKPVGLRAVARDISERKRDAAEQDKLREKLLMAEKLAALGQLILGISHEYNNILAGLRATAELAGLPGKRNKLEELPDSIVRLVDRAQDITKGLLGFARRFEPVISEVKVMEIVQETLDLAAYAIKQNNVAVELDIPEALTVRTEAGKLQEALLNLVVNAVQAMKSGGSLTVNALADDKHVKIMVADTGVGIPPENLRRVFEPFFTTKGSIGGSEVPGTGLGLSLSYGIIQSLGGDIFVESEIDKGSVFTIFLPRRDSGGEGSDGMNDSDKSNAPPAQPWKNARVLVVEDEPSIRETLIEYMNVHGIFASGAENGDEGLGKVKSNKFDIAFVDLLMPKMPGEEFVAKANKIDPSLKFIIITGMEFAAEEDEIRIRNLPNCVGILKKPFRFEAAIRVVGEGLK